MAAVGAIVAFTVSLILYIAGGKAGAHWVDAELAGFILLAVALACPGWWGLRGPHP